MKKTYQQPQIEVIALGTEQGVLGASINVLMATTPPEPSNSMDMSAGAAWGNWN